MTWQWLVLLVTIIVAASGLGAWWMWLVHDSEPVDDNE